MYYQVKEVSKMTGLSVRMLHHYDKIGLLKPAAVTEAGYRQYSEDNLVLLQQIMFLKELDFSLETIGEILNRSDYDIIHMLERHKVLLEKKVERLLKIIETIDKTRDHYERGDKMLNEERFDGFDMTEIEAHKAKYAKEVAMRWGETDAYEESRNKMSTYGPEDYKRIQLETEGIYKEIIDLMDQPVSDSRVQALVHSLRIGITDNFYECTKEIFAGLGEMYVLDDRFKDNLNGYGEGFAEYLSKAIAWYSAPDMN